ncbi:ATP-binding protein [Streptomyces sp. ISL-98]|nr:ATP-binding protein [Streptomyces sp. ISL-98]
MVVCRWTSCTPDAPARARAELRRVLAQLGLSGEDISDAVLAVSELVANATEHAPGPYEMRLRRTAAEYICEIEDGDPRIPAIPAFPSAAPFEADPEGRGGGIDALLKLLAERGRGLRIVDELTGGDPRLDRARGHARGSQGPVPGELPRTRVRADRNEDPALLVPQPPRAGRIPRPSLLEQGCP